MNDYEKYEIECDRIRAENEKLLEEFSLWLKKSGLTERTVSSHNENVAFYINEFLLYSDIEEAKDGAYSINMYLGYWFIKKAMWSSEASIKSNATSLKKFYTFMNEKGLVDNETLQDLKDTIKEEMAGWLRAMRKYDDLTIDDVW